ncbi:MAG: hypothetical protein IPJ81_19515 [Chitinophagaceae bacterium]|nr:hypothetical protein [Chitinophagaceae bacterium]
MSTRWRLPLSAGNKNFTATGTVKQMNATLLNQIIEPLAMASVKEGKIKKLDFNLSGNDYKGTGDVLFLYNDLNVEILKKGKDDELKTRDLISFFANKLVKNENPRGDETYTGKVDFERDIYKSFFNLLWKSLFDGVKKTVLGKKNK